MSWHFVERWLQKVNQHSTLIGKFWITFLIIFRIVVVSSVGDRVYSDEQSEFKCNSLQIGCPNLCFNKFSPISHIRFWSFQIIMVTTPSIVFMVYSAHQIKKKPPVKEKSSVTGPTPSPTKKAEMAAEAIQFEDDDNKKKRKKSTTRPTSLANTNDQQDARKLRQSVIQEMFGEEKSAFSQHYILYTSSVLMRTLVEILFIVLQYRLFGFRVSQLYKCTGDPCPNIVDCFVSRPMEKTIFLWFMFIIAVICLALNVVEMYYLLWQFGVRRTRLERKRKRYQRSTLSEVRGAQLADAEILDGGVFPVHGAPPPDYRGVMNFPDVDAIELVPTTGVAGGTTGLAMSFSLDDAMLADQGNSGRYPVVYGATPSAGGSSRSNNNAFTGPVEVSLTDQPYMANPRNGKGKPNDYYDYV